MALRNTEIKFAEDVTSDVKEWLGLPDCFLDLNTELFDYLEFNPESNPGFLFNYNMLGAKRQEMAGRYKFKKGACYQSAIKLAKKLFIEITNGGLNGLRIPFTLGGREKMNEFSIVGFWEGGLDELKSRPIMMEDFVSSLISSFVLQQFNIS